MTLRKVQKRFPGLGIEAAATGQVLSSFRPLGLSGSAVSPAGSSGLCPVLTRLEPKHTSEVLSRGAATFEAAGAGGCP